MTLAHPVIETNVWDSSSKSILALFGYDDTTDINVGYNAIYGHLYIPVGPNTYRNVNFGPITEDGGYPEVISVFFANADKGKEKELIVMCKYWQKHYDYDGDFYETFIYSHPGKDDALTYFKELSEKFWGCECGWREGKTEVAKYKTAKEVRRQLLKMGFK